MMKRLRQSKPLRLPGESLIGLIAGILIFALIATVISAFALSIYKSRGTNESRSQIDQQTIIVMRNFTKELRTAQQSNAGGYPVAGATDHEVVFYSDIRDDGIVDRIRYARDGSAFVRGVIVPSGSPLSYNPANETITTLIPKIQSATPLFNYYGSEYDGVTSTAPLAQPITLSDIRVVEIAFTIEPESPGVPPVSASTKVNIRSLRDN